MCQRLLRGSLVVLLAISMSSCEEVFTEIAEGLGEQNCVSDAANPTGPDKRMWLFAKNHIYVVGDSGQYDPNGTTKHPWSGSP